MKEYQAKIDNSSCFNLSQDGKFIGNLSYESWFKFNALIELADNLNYKIEPRGFWGTTIEVKDKDKVLLKLKMNWNGGIVMQACLDNIEKGYVFKHRGIFRESFMLIDQGGIELLIMKPHVRWSKMTCEYQITTSDEFEKLSNKEILLITSLHCANYYMSMTVGRGVNLSS